MAGAVAALILRLSAVPEAWCAERRYHIYKVVKALKHLPQNVLEPPDGAPALLLKFIGELGNCTRILNTP